MKKVFVLALSLFTLCGVAFAQEDVTFGYGDNLLDNYSGNLIINAPAYVNSAVNITGNLIINSEITISGELTVGGTIYVYGGSIIAPMYTDVVLRDVVLEGGTLSSSFFGSITIDNLTINESAQPPTLSGDLTINKSINVEGGKVNVFGSMTLGEYCEINVDPDVETDDITGWTRKEFSLQPGWNFVGFPHVGNISPLAQDAMPILWAYRFDYNANAWGTNFLHWNDQQKDLLAKGNGIFVWSNQAVTTSLIGPSANEEMTINYTGNVGDNQPNWMALANPYFEVLNIESFLGQTYDNGSPRCQGGYVYKWNGNTFVTAQTGTINTFEGFFVNVAKSNVQTGIEFTPSMTGIQNKTTAQREFVSVSVLTDGYAVPVVFAQNDAATVDYDVYDADKMFGTGAVAEPYLVCGERLLCKEEVNTADYVGNMNIKSSEARSVEIVASNIPEGYSVVLKDGENEIAMLEGDVYTTDIASGENEGRFKLLINKNNVSIADIENVSDLSVMNNNRNIIIRGGKNVRTEVYNVLGQKVYETTERNFSLNGVNAGAYVLKVQSDSAVASSKIVVE
ncbi:MAG: T9SS type A sorting domain-containing protein [Bacteroidales bacterium]|nr:T9SS type A sorting domain-containing protein [Bacteroidales bacterium]